MNTGDVAAILPWCIWSDSYRVGCTILTFIRNTVLVTQFWRHSLLTWWCDDVDSYMRMTWRWHWRRYITVTCIQCLSSNGSVYVNGRWLGWHTTNTWILLSRTVWNWRELYTEVNWYWRELWRELYNDVTLTELCRELVQKSVSSYT